MNDVAIFESSEFGTVRMADIEGKIYFCGSDVAKALGYKDTVNALKLHCKEGGVVFHHIIDTLGRLQEAKFITEGNVYRLITHSKLPTAEKFEKWVFDEVLPTIRQTGSYTVKNDTTVKKHSLSEVNDMIKILNQVYTAAGVDSKFIANATGKLYEEQAGIHIPLTIEVKEEKLYDCTEIARDLKIYSKSMKPHNKAVAAIIKKLCISDDFKVTTPFMRNGHSDVTTQYKEPVIEKIRKWLFDNSYPSAISYTDKNGTEGTCYVTYCFDE